MYCIKCGKKLENDDKFCDNCGTAVDNNLQNNIPQSQTSTPKISTKDNQKITDFMKWSLVFLAMRFASYFFYSISLKTNIEILIKIANTIYMVPWLVISLIFAIISRVKYKDKLSSTFICINIVLIIIGFIILCMAVIFFFFISIAFGYFMIELLEGCTSIG